MSLSWTCNEWDFSEFEPGASVDGGLELRLSHCLDADDGEPFLNLMLTSDERLRGGAYSNISVYIDGYERIDELRRYCEMVLDHIKRRDAKKCL